MNDALRLLKSETAMAEFIPYTNHITPTIVATDNADYVSVWKLAGRAHECADQDEVFDWVRDLNNFVKSFGNAGVSFWTHIHRRKVHEYPQSEFDNDFCRRFDDKYRQSFTESDLKVNDLYFSIVYRIATDDAVMGFFAKRERISDAEKRDRQAEAIKTLDDMNRQLERTFRAGYGGELLGEYEHNGHLYSSALEWFSFLVNGERTRVPITRDYIADTLPMNRVLFSKWGEIGEQRLNLSAKTQVFGMLEIRDYDAWPEPGHLDLLLSSPFEFVLTQSFACLSPKAASDRLGMHKQGLIDAKDPAESQIKQIDDALDALASREFVMGEHHATLLIFGDSVPEVRKHMSKASGLLTECGVVPGVVDRALAPGYWAQLPANFKWRARRKPITSLNFLCFSPQHNYLCGKPNGNPWGPAVTIFKTASKTPLYYSFHVSELDEDSRNKRLPGITGIIGQTGAGKTMLLGALLTQAQKFKPTSVVFDLDRGMETTTLALGGKYLVLRNGTDTGLAPCQMETTPTNMILLKALVMQLVGKTAPVTHNDERQIDEAIRTVMFGTMIPKPLRSFTRLCENLPHERRADDAHPTVHSRLEKWCKGGEFGWVFDNERDELDLTTHRTYGFDLTDFIKNPVIRTPIVMYLLHRTEAMIDGRPFIYVFDEFWRLLDDPQFLPFVHEKLKTIRKANGLPIFATQEPGDALDSPIGKTIMQQLATLFLLHNPRADRKDYIEGLKLTEAEFECVMKIPYGSAEFLVKQGQQAAMANMYLGPEFADEKLILSGTPDTADIAEECVREFGDAWEPEYLKRVRAKEKK